MTGDVHNWQPLSVEEVANLLSGLAVPWWIAGGWAIDLYVGCHTRTHRDIDVLVRRDDQLEVRRHLSGWDFAKTGLKRWLPGEFLKPPVNDIWCRRTPDSPWLLQLMLLDTDGGEWVFRRDPSIRGSLEGLGCLTPSGIPYLAPEIQLLYKAKGETLDRDQTDFDAALPLLERSACAWLLECLTRRFPQGHAWVNELRRRLSH